MRGVLSNVLNELMKRTLRKTTTGMDDAAGARMLGGEKVQKNRTLFLSRVDTVVVWILTNSRFKSG